MRSPLLPATLLAVLLALPGVAHESIPDQIHHLTDDIEQQPRNAALYLKRGELHRIRGDRESAERDYEKASRLDPALRAVDLARGLLLLELDRSAEAIAPLQRYVRAHPNDPLGRITFARVLAKVQQPFEAAAEFDAALDLSGLDPDLIVERAHALVAGQYPREALRTLDEAMEHLGPVVSLQLTAIELELQMCNAEAALRRIAAAEQTAPRKETWLARRADLLRDLGREDEARTAYQSALAALSQLPPERRLTRAMKDLELRLRERLE